MKIALAFGLGKESTKILKKLLKKKPILITCIGKEDTICKEMIKLFGQALKLKTIIINETFKENWEWFECDGKFMNITYDNTILKYFKKRKRPFDVLYVGRKRKDLIKRGKYKDKEVPKKINIKGVAFPLWSK